MAATVIVISIGIQGSRGTVSEPLVDSPSAQGVHREAEPDLFHGVFRGTSRLSGSETAPPRHLAAVTQRLRRGVQERRQAAFRHADYLGVKRHPTAYRERYTRSVPYIRWIRALWAKRAHRLWLRRVERDRVPLGEAELRAYINDDCLEEIVDRETAGTWSPTVYNYSGSGAYGLPQALPGSKMASAGRDWRTNPKTQIAWMRGYVNGRYGGSCGALAFHNANGWY